MMDKRNLDKDKQLMDQDGMQYFHKTHGFKAPFNVFCDVSYMKFLAASKKNPIIGLKEVLNADLKLYTTSCVRELLASNEELSDLVQHTWCCHVESGLLACLDSVVECQNYRKFIFATADDIISHTMQQRYGVPVVVCKGANHILKRVSKVQRDSAMEFFNQSKRAQELNRIVIEFYMTHYLIDNKSLKILLDGPFIQHLALNGIGLTQLVELVGTDLNSLYTTSCIYEEMKVGGNSYVSNHMRGALILASGFIHESCGHVETKTGKECLQSLLVKGKHIGAILKTSRVLFGKVQKMDGVPLIFAKEKRLILKPPSESVINSQEDDMSKRVKLLEILAESEKLEEPPKKTRQEQKAKKKMLAELESRVGYEAEAPLAKKRKMDTTNSG